MTDNKKSGIWKLFGITSVFIIIIGISVGCGKREKIVLVHTSDTHSEYFPIDQNGLMVGGASRRYTLLQDIRRQTENSITIDTGGILTGTIYSSMYKGSCDIELMNRMQYDMMGIGHHEFDYGLENLMALKKTAEFPFLSANIYDANGENRIFKPYMITNIRGIRIVFIGLSPSDWGLYNQTLKDKIQMRKPEDSLRELLTSLKLGETNDLIVAVSYLGIQKNMELAQDFPEIDVILSGYGSTTTPVPRTVGNTILVQAGENGIYCGALTLEVQNGQVIGSGYRLITLDSRYAYDYTIDNYLDQKRMQAETLMLAKVCSLAVPLDNSGVRMNSIPLANLVADALREVSGCEIAVINSGGIRGDLPVGTVRMGDLYELYPYENTLVTMKVKGIQIYKAIRKSVMKRGSGAFLHFSKGLKIRVKAGESLENGKSVEIEWNGAPFDTNRVYNVAISDFLWQGGDGYNEFENGFFVRNTGLKIRELLIGYLSNKNLIQSQDIERNPRIEFEN